MVTLAPMATLTPLTCLLLAIGPAESPGAGSGFRFEPNGAGETLLRLADPARWIAEPGWLGNPARHFEAHRGQEGVLFRVNDSGRGMKWRSPLEAAISLAGFRHVSIRYRAIGAGREGDYVLAILGGPEGGAETYAAPIASRAIVADGRWHNATGALGGAASAKWFLRGMALQVQSGGGPAEMEVSEIRLSGEAPLVPLSDSLPFVAAAREDPLRKTYRPIDLSSLAGADGLELRALFRLDGWLPPGSLVACGIYFEPLSGPKSAVVTGLEDESAVISVPLSGLGKVGGLALLLAARFEGNEEPAIGSGELQEIRDVDRLLFRILYRDGSADEMMCFSLPREEFLLLRGLQVAILFADPERDIHALEIIDRSRQVALYLMAAAALPAEGAPVLRHRPRAGPSPLRKWRAPKLRACEAILDGSGQRLILRGGAVEAEVEVQGLRLRRLWNGHRQADLSLGEGSHVLGVAAGGTEIPLSECRIAGAHPPAEGQAILAAEVRRERPASGVSPGTTHLLVQVRLRALGDELQISSSVENRGDAIDLELFGPELSGVSVEDPRTDRLFYPKRGAVLTSKPCAYSRPASGLFPVQFMDLSAAGGGGLYVRTEAGYEPSPTSCGRIYEASKDIAGTRLAVRYDVRLEHGQALTLPATAIGVHGGEWHVALDAYKRWLGTWYRPRQPLKPWFREVFNFRQRFLWFWDPMYEKGSGRFRIREALEECRAEFGGLEYLHLMDWGSHPVYGRVYGRIGDYEPWEAWKGGPDSLAAAIREASAEGVPVGLYVEGYLLEERGKLGAGPGTSWQILGPAGERRYWPGATEMFICPWAKAWREIQVDTYRRLASLFPARGFYIDQFGFADWGKACWAKDHGHGPAAKPLLGERETTRAISEALEKIEPQIAIYTEETPCDIAGMYQDGSFTYAMNDAQRSVTDVPLSIARFIFPAFKTFEILVCDMPTGSWATGVLWTFFNGEGIWLEGPPREWFRPLTLEAIRKTHAILREHREAFATLAPEPLVPTLTDTVFANFFPGEREVVYTLWNSMPITYHGAVLELPKESAGRRVVDAWRGRPADLRPGKDDAIEVWSDLAPHGVGCIIVDR